MLEKFQMAISPQPVVYLRNGSRSTYARGYLCDSTAFLLHLSESTDPLNLLIIDGDMKENVSGCLFLNTVYYDVLNRIYQ